MKFKVQTNSSNSEGDLLSYCINGSKTDLFVGLSFDTISATGPNGAIIHYKPEKKTCATIQQNEIYLCDSGAQFRFPQNQ